MNNRVFYIPKTVGFGLLHNIASHILGLERIEVRLHRFYVSMPTISSNQVSVQALLQAKTSNDFCSIFRLLRSALRKDTGVSSTMINDVVETGIQRV